MLNDFEIIARHFPENNDIKIYPISDVHLGAAEHLTTEWDNFCKRILEEPKSYVILGGDLLNNSTRSSVADIFEETMRPRDQKRRMAEMLKPIKHKILCAVNGNHERRSGKDSDDDPTYDIMCKLDLEHLYRENMAFLCLRFGKKRGRRQKESYIYFCCHPRRRRWRFYWISGKSWRKVWLCGRWHGLPCFGAYAQSLHNATEQNIH